MWPQHRSSYITRTARGGAAADAAAVWSCRACAWERRREGIRKRKKNAVRSASESNIRWSARAGADTFLFLLSLLSTATAKNFTITRSKTSTLRQALPSEIGAFGQLELRALGAEMKVESSLVPCISGILTRLTPTVYILTGLSGVFWYF